VCRVEAGDQAGLGISLMAGICFFDGLNGDATSFLAAFVSSHAIGYDDESSLLPEIFLVGGLPIGVIVFIIIALAANIGEAGEFDSGPDLHLTSGAVARHHQLLSSFFTFSGRDTSASLARRSWIIPKDRAELPALSHLS